MKTTRIHTLLTVIALSIAFPIPAPGQTTAASVVDCWAAALGGRDHLASIESLERSGSIETGGLQGTFRSWHTVSGALRTDVELGPYQSTDAFDGHHAWTKTGTAPAHDLTDADLERIISEAYSESLSMFFDDRMKGSIVLLESKDGTTLEITPAGGRTLTIRMDPETCLPLSIEQPERDRTVRVDVLEWVEVDGIRFPKKLRQSTGDPAYDVVILYETIRINSEIPEGLFAGEPESKSGVAWNGRASVSTPLELTQNHPYVPVYVNGKGPSMFILDTGADLTVIEKGHAAEIGLAMEGSIEIRGAGESTLDAAMIAGPSVRIAGLDIPSDVMIAVPLGPLSLYEGRPIQGILGYDVLSRFVVEVDYAAKKATLHDPSKFAAPGDARPFEITFDGNTPVMKAVIALPDGRSFDVRLTLDTGNRTSLILHQPFVEAHGIRASLPTIESAPLGMGVGGLTRQDLGRIASLSLGDSVMEAPLTSFSIEQAGANANPDIDGNVGGEVLRRFTLWIDYGKKRILLRPNRSLSDPFEYDMSGLLLANATASRTEPVVLNVLPGSPAQEAGVKVNDVIVTIDGTAASSLTLEAIRMRLSQPDREIRLTIHRGGSTTDLRLKTRRMI